MTKRQGTLLHGGSASEVGRRQVNQDRVLVSNDSRLFVVADGMGGHRGGATAAELTVTELARNPVTNTDSLRDAIVEANRVVYERSQIDPDLHGMGTTITAIALVEVDGEERIAVANVGDSRTYLLRNGEIEQLTEDHTLVAELIRDGQLTLAEAKTHKNKSVVTRAVGVESIIDIDLLEVLPQVGDRYLLCSDGLSGDVNPAVMAATLRRFADPGEASRDLIRIALANGSKDNISVVVVEVTSDGDSSLAASLAASSSLSLANGRLIGGEESTIDPARPYGAQTLTGRTRTDTPTETRQKRTPRPRGKRVITARSLAFFAFLGIIAGVAWWALSHAPTETISDPTIPSTLTVPSTTLALSQVPGSTSLPGSTLTLPTSSPSQTVAPTVVSGGIEDNFVGTPGTPGTTTP